MNDFKQTTARQIKAEHTFMKRLATLVFSAILCLQAAAQTTAEARQGVVMETSKGTIRIELYNETPLHRDNFIRLVKEGFYDGLLFHRVISSFMIQGGDPASRNAIKGQMPGASADTATIPAEIRFPALFHKRGALCAAREGDSGNPQRASSASQFYIVYGTRFNDEMLDQVQKRLDSKTNGAVKLTAEVREAYKTKGGTPHLDGQYTVFGEVTESMDVVKEIQWADTDENDRPIEDIRIIKATAY